MEIVKDLTSELTKLEAKDRYYYIEAEIPYLLATQDPKTTRQYTYKKTGWGSIERVESHTEGAGTPSSQTAPRRKGRKRTGEEEIKTGRCFSFRTTENNEVLLPWGGPFGILKQGLRRTLDAKGKMRYENPKLDLIRIFPKTVKVPAPLNSMINDTPEAVLTTRHSMGGDVMVDEFFDYIENKPVSFYVEVDSECPINEEKFVGLMKSLTTLDNFGAAKRGQVKIQSIKQVNLSKDELSALE
jgi:hypothetical protein